ncbi:MAG: GFA family protein [Myxococcales bacterium]|nr:GFA family protein [Myxococcales bacterium]
MAESPTIQGRCLCGDVRFEVCGPLLPLGYCHCKSCQRASGSAFAANAAVRTSDVIWRGGQEQITEYASSPGKRRAFCSRCGSPVYACVERQPDWLSIRLGSLDDDPCVRPGAHFNVAERAHWYPLTDGLPQHSGDHADAVEASAENPLPHGNLGDAFPAELPEELATDLASIAHTRIERIISRGHRSATDFWYDQDEDEFVLLVRGAARLELEGGDELALGPGDWVHIPAHVRHRVAWTDTEQDTLWLAVFASPTHR